MPLDPRLQAVTDLNVTWSRESAGLHEYDGRLQDLSPTGVQSALARLGGEPRDDPYDEALVTAFEDGYRYWFGELDWHRRNPLLHVENLDLSGYERDYAPAEERATSRLAHLASWPDGVAMAVEALDRVPAPVATATLASVRGLAAAVLPADGEVGQAALLAHARLVAHLEQAARNGEPHPAIGGAALARGLGVTEATDVDLGVMAQAADLERDRLHAMLADACGRIAPGRPTDEVVADVRRDHPDADGVLDEARALTAQVLEFTRAHRLAPYTDGVCLVGPAPESRRWSMAMMSWAAPEEPDAPSWYHVTPPDPAWPEDQQEAWLAVFNRASLAAITVHEVSPGHFAHSRAMRRVESMPRRVLQSMSFAEGWAHHAEEVLAEVGFHADDPRFLVGVALEALVRVARMACAIGLHTGAMTVEDAARRFEQDAFLQGPAALSEARRGTFDPTYGRYTWGKLAIRDLREQAVGRWGAEYSHERFHAALLSLGSPPLGLMGAALEVG